MQLRIDFWETSNAKKNNFINETDEPHSLLASDAVRSMHFNCLWELIDNYCVFTKTEIIA